MRASELAMQLSAMHSDIDDISEDTFGNLNGQFKTDTTNNEDSAQEANLHFAMADYIIISSLASKYSKLVAKAKTLLDDSVQMLDQSPEGIPGQSILLGKSNLFQFSKKQNQDSTSTPLNAFVTELARAGVEKSVVDKALKAATMPKKGNTYYNVTLVEE